MTAGHNSVAADILRAFVSRIENLEEEKKALGDDIRDVYSEAHGQGFNKAILRKVVALRKKDADARAEEEAILNVYLSALGMQSDLFSDGGEQ